MATSTSSSELPLLAHDDIESRQLVPGPPLKEDDTSLAAVRLLFATVHNTRVFVILVTIIAHAAFIYGQTQIMWYLYFSMQLDTTLEARSVPAKWAFAALQVPNPVDVNLVLNHTIEDFTYWTAIRGLWLGNTNPGPHTTSPGFWGKVSSIVLVFFSGLWPHVKLVSLQYVRCTRRLSRAYLTI